MENYEKMYNLLTTYITEILKLNNKGNLTTEHLKLLLNKTKEGLSEIDNKKYSTIKEVIEASFDKIIYMSMVRELVDFNLANLLQEVLNDVKIAVKNEFEVKVEYNRTQVLYGPPPTKEEHIITMKK